jgi:ssDNA-binding Zn-finger/Zn-ribbon topoisomerase 1
MICEACGDSVEFIYPGPMKSICKNHHIVTSNIEELIKIKLSPKSNILSKEKFCPKCNMNMSKKWSKVNRQYFWGCNNYPRCNGTLPVKSKY